MGFALGNEFFRNLGWNGFKPDRHIVRVAQNPDLVARVGGDAIARADAVQARSRS